MVESTGGGQYSVCVDIFSQINQLLTTFNSLSTNQNARFSHSNGFQVDPTLQTASNSDTFDATRMESDMCLKFVVILALLFFAWNGFSRRQKSNIHKHDHDHSQHRGRPGQNEDDGTAGGVH